LTPGRARVFQSDCEWLIGDFKTGIPKAFETEAYEQQKNAITQAAEKEQSKELEALKERVEAVRQGQFHVYPVRTIDEGIALLVGVLAGEAGLDGSYPEGTVNFLIQRRLRELAEQARTFRGNGEPSSSRSDDADTAHP